MKRSFREPKNRYKNGAKNDRKKIATLKSAQSLENKGKTQGTTYPKGIKKSLKIFSFFEKPLYKQKKT